MNSSERAAARLLGLDSTLLERAARRLERERIIRRGLAVEGFRERLSVLVRYI